MIYEHLACCGRYDPSPGQGVPAVSRRDTRAQSTVIGVILLVLVTVILAGFVAVFVFDLSGDQLQNPSPQARFSWSNTSDGLVAAHGGGDPVRASDLEIIVIDDGTRPFAHANGTDPEGGNVSRITGDDVFQPHTVRIGDSAIVAHDVGRNDSTRIVYIDPETQRGSILSNYRPS